MSVTRLTLKKQAVKALQRMPDRDAGRVHDELKKLAQDPGRRDLDFTRLQGRDGFRLRVGRWRIILTWDENAREIHVLRIAPRGDVYKN